MGDRIKQYWEDRAKQNPGSLTGTTNDVWLRELEIKSLTRALSRIAGSRSDNLSLLDIGCGDGYSTLRLARAFPDFKLTGVDYAENMIDNAKQSLNAESVGNVNFAVADATQIARSFPNASFDVVITDRCLINLDSAEKQYDTIAQIAALLKAGGRYLGIENFLEGQAALTAARNAVGLPEIPVRWHNLYFDGERFLKEVTRWFSTVTFDDFSSSYYYATRVLYSAMCKARGEEPDYTHDIHRLAVDLPPVGLNFSPIRMFTLTKPA
jgi:ubiquinone/menaquinone biosynthesis C-methylase UbiE